jgi:hypothetical protein
VKVTESTQSVKSVFKKMHHAIYIGRGISKLTLETKSHAMFNNSNVCRSVPTPCTIPFGRLRKSNTGRVKVVH